MKKSETWDHQAATQIRTNKKVAAQAARVAREGKRVAREAKRIHASQLKSHKKVLLKIEADLKIEMLEHRILDAASRAARGSMPAAAFVIQQRARQKIKRSRTASMPGQPPATRRGLLSRSILYVYDATHMEAVIGPAASRVGESAAAHEFGGRYKQEKYPARPFMGPTLTEQAGVIPDKFRNTIGP